jgi:hypothetical protein
MVIKILKQISWIISDFLLVLSLKILFQKIKGINMYKVKMYSNNKSQKLIIVGGMINNSQGVIPQNVHFHLLSLIMIKP